MSHFIQRSHFSLTCDDVVEKVSEKFAKMHHRHKRDADADDESVDDDDGDDYGY